MAGLAWLERAGWSYEPDLIVVGFVLNDLTELLSLVRYGGQGRAGSRAPRGAGSIAGSRRAPLRR